MPAPSHVTKNRHPAGSEGSLFDPIFLSTNLNSAPYFFLRVIRAPAPLIRTVANPNGNTFHAAIAFFDQQFPHNPSGITTTSVTCLHSGHSRAGHRNSTSATAFINWINRITEIANWTVFRFHTSADTTLRITPSSQ
jgi:hypothetical protein